MGVPVVKVTPFGIQCPTFQQIYDALVAEYQGVYGSDVLLTADTQDGEWLGIQAQAMYDTCLAAVDVYNSFAPAYAQGTGLSSLVKINGLRRLVATPSTAPVTIVGQPGTPINGGLIGDNLGLNTQWSIPNLTIGLSGSIDTTATCTTLGAVTAVEGSLTKILTPTRGWQSVTNTDDATVGSPVEDDAQLRQRQSISTGKPAQTPLESILAEVANTDGVDAAAIYENDTDGVVAGIPPHSIAVVADGGHVQDIIDSIGSKKNPGTGTIGNVSGTYVDPAGVEDSISYYTLTKKRIEVVIDGIALTGWSTTTIPIIQQAVANYINGLIIGGNVNIANTSAAATLTGDPLYSTFDITSVTQAIHGNSQLAANIAIAFNERATCQVSDVTVNIA